MLPRLALLVLLSVAQGVAAEAPPETAPPPLVAARAAVLHDALVGTWRARIGDRSLVMRLDADGDLQLGPESGTWSVAPRSGHLVLGLGEREDALTAVLTNAQLTLSGGSLTQPQVFARDPDLGDFLVGWFGIKPDSGGHRWLRVLAIVLWIVAARLAIWLVQLAGRTVILSRWGPFRLVFPHQPLRAATLLSLLLNTGKYAVYAVGLGFVLSSFDVDYTTYIASLSVIGLAIGFGSQGLVQDMVTGLFILVESQFDVGDIVEVSGQIGVVQEMGLRMTRLRTIQNQVVTIPNRSIATVARFGPRGLQVELSAAPEAERDPEAVAAIMERCAGEIARQFAAAVLAVRPPRIEPGDGGRQVVRLDLDLWPGQQAVIDQHLLPRLRGALPAEAHGDTATTLAWHFDRPDPEAVQLGRIGRWFTRQREREADAG